MKTKRTYPYTGQLSGKSYNQRRIMPVGDLAAFVHAALGEVKFDNYVENGAWSRVRVGDVVIEPFYKRITAYRDGDIEGVVLRITDVHKSIRRKVLLKDGSFDMNAFTDKFNELTAMAARLKKSDELRLQDEERKRNLLKELQTEWENLTGSKAFVIRKVFDDQAIELNITVTREEMNKIAACLTNRSTSTPVQSLGHSTITSGEDNE